MMMLKNKTALITGASSGIGREAAKIFAKEGAALVLVARRAAELGSLVDEIISSGGRAVMLAADVKDEACAKEAVRLAVHHFGGLDIAFNNAATMGEMGETTGISLEGWNETIETNLTSAFLAAKYQIPAMLQRGNASLIFTSSFVGHAIGFPGMAAYAASKAGLIGLTRALAAEYSPAGIRVNALLPGGTDTEMGRSSTDTPEKEAFINGLHAMKRRATPVEIANSALYLASELSAFTTGTALFVDGGVSINRT
ncbi:MULTISPECIES: SDR family oxidoreductase [Erwinia]|uniref:Short-chain dehydrogenase n=1 Tax=Erwinia rhapontici TaxID=55212 RepID=A0ABM7N349_ERWRD|nr:MULTISPECIES: SDR family oxidoreductase [Erwinia]MCS3607798.1 NAD(P)-dependent dehydrogenase (short-subunit alcohol dehydrogenase family) [Erwinia rhapontici]NNS07398.1 SDR family oxidoreductase [Erwinia sp. JH02]TDT01751.1 NAD(P)-dependent dehydrogenase (short-subunit alcohol dehydrogenase family) [Erwinia rhapontici]BCQ35910.1 short-chain dehydrogenase [Erwinia rhapontici]BCQ40832.1 short-chain dehydrogenase [Erwinia rhapontici]